MKREDFLKQYQTKEWYNLSKRIKARDNNTCQLCGKNNVPLTVHHLHYGENGSILDVPDSSLITLCEECHRKQDYYRIDTEYIINELRTQYTDFEIFLMVVSLEEKYYQDRDSIKYRPIKESIIPKSLRKYHLSFYRNISKWREKVLKIAFPCNNK